MSKDFNLVGDIIKNVEDLEQETEVSFDDLFSVKFMNKNSDFNSIYDLLEKAGLKIETNEDFEKLEEPILDEIINRFTKFDSWNSILNEATADYVQRKMFEGIK